jgi:AcrR family transcriptional regulator
MPKVSQEHSDARRRQIIDAAYQCFARKGFHQTSMRDIYQQAGLSPGAVYHYFDSKDAIIQASFEFDYERSRDLFAAAATSDDPLKALVELLDFFLQGLKGAAELGAGRVNVQGWGEALVNPKLGAPLQRFLAYYQDSVALVVRKAQDVGQIDNRLDPLAVSQVVLSLYYGLELQKSLNPALEIDLYAAAARALLRPARQTY